MEPTMLETFHCRSDGISVFNFWYMQASELSKEQRDFLIAVSKRYVWWMEVAQTINDPDFLISQVMNMGDCAESGNLFQLFSEEDLRGVISNSKPGWFNDRVAWAHGIIYFFLNITTSRRLCLSEKFQKICTYDRNF